MAKRISPRVSLSVETLEDRCLMDATVCLVDPAPGPTVPRLNLTLLSPFDMRMVPGDQKLPPKPAAVERPLILCFPPASEGGTFSDCPIPPGFFGPGSAPFDGPVHLGGDSAAPADTVVHRAGDPSPIQGSTIGAPGTIPIELIQLDLHSVKPVQVNPGGGTFTAHLNVRPVLVFTDGPSASGPACDQGPKTAPTLNTLDRLSNQDLLDDIDKLRKAIQKRHDEGFHLSDPFDALGNSLQDSFDRRVAELHRRLGK